MLKGRDGGCYCVEQIERRKRRIAVEVVGRGGDWTRMRKIGRKVVGMGRKIGRCRGRIARGFVDWGGKFGSLKGRRDKGVRRWVCRRGKRRLSRQG
jgi:hypothetical protein